MLFFIFLPLLAISVFDPGLRRRESLFLTIYVTAPLFVNPLIFSLNIFW